MAKEVVDHAKGCKIPLPQTLRQRLERFLKTAPATPAQAALFNSVDAAAARAATAASGELACAEISD
jgi:hypothetical protein